MHLKIPMTRKRDELKNLAPKDAVLGLGDGNIFFAANCD
jgi:hypothetical protein